MLDLGQDICFSKVNPVRVSASLIQTGLSKVLFIHSVPVLGDLQLEKLSSSQILLEMVVLWPCCYL